MSGEFQVKFKISSSRLGKGQMMVRWSGESQSELDFSGCETFLMLVTRRNRKQQILMLCIRR